MVLFSANNIAVQPFRALMIVCDFLIFFPCPLSNFQCSTGFLKLVLLPSLGKGKHLICWTP